MYISKGTRGLEYSKERVYSEMLNWIVSHPDFALVRKGKHNEHHDHDHEKPLHTITKKARTKFKHFHRDTLKKFHKEMKRNHQKSVKTRMKTPVAPNKGKGGYIPAYLREA